MSKCIALRWHHYPTLNAALKLMPLSCGGGLISVAGPVPRLHVNVQWVTYLRVTVLAVFHPSISQQSHFLSSCGQLELLLGCPVVSLNTVCCSDSGMLSEMLPIHCRAFSSSGDLASALLLLFSWVAVSVFIPSLQTVFSVGMRMSGLYRVTSTELLSWGN